MPQTRLSSNGDLSIALDGGDRATFRPGELLVGRVSRTTPILSPAATLTISLYGRAKAKAVEKKGTRIEYRSRVNLISSEKSLKTLLCGPLHIALGEAVKELRFEITIPTHIDPAAIRPETVQKGVHSPLGGQFTHQNPLPASFYAQSLRNEAFVEYYLEANLEAQRQDSSLSWQARFPIQLQQFRPGPPLVDNRLITKPLSFSLRSQRLLPNMEDSELTTSQKFKKLIHAPSIPALCFTLEVTLPTVVQLGRTPIPFQVRAVPEMEKSSEVLRAVPQTITLASMKVELERLHQVECQGMFDTIAANWTAGVDLMDGKYLFNRSDTYEIPYSVELSPIDLGEKVRLRIFNGQVPITSDKYITPDITAPNIILTHRLKWEIKFEIAREVMRANGSRTVQVLPPAQQDSEDYTRPPPEDPHQDAWIKPPQETDAGDLPPFV